jgi:hypothetical protein
VDEHDYWWRGESTFEDWRGDTFLTTNRSSMTYQEKIEHWRTRLDELGYPDIDLAFLEWNVFPGTPNKSRYEAALIDAEILMSMIRGGLDMAAFWPLHWREDSANDWHRMGLVDVDDTGDSPRIELTPIYRMFSLFTSVLGHEILEGPNRPGTLTVAARGGGGDVLTVFVLRKVDRSATITIDLETVVDGRRIRESDIRTIGLAPGSGDHSAASAVLEERPASPTSETSVAVSMRPFSLAKITIDRSS